MRRAEQDRDISGNSGQDAGSCAGAWLLRQIMAPYSERNEDIRKSQLSVNVQLIKVLGGGRKTYDRLDLRASD
jgi:hypothetical protein